MKTRKNVKNRTQTQLVKLEQKKKVLERKKMRSLKRDYSSAIA